jgi:cytochrome c oxidase subunit III
MSNAEAGTHHERAHPYHLVEPSPWPALGALSAFVLAVGLIMFLHDYAGGRWVTAAGVALILVTMVVWWRDVIRESLHGEHTAVVRKGLRFGMVLFIASEVMFFVAWFWAFFHPFYTPPLELAQFPPETIEPPAPFDIPFLNTLILLLSGSTVTWAHHAIREGDNRTGAKAIALTAGLGIIFTSLQIYEYGHLEFGITDTIYGSAFYMATGFHGAHVIIGTAFLLVCLYRAMRNEFTPDKHIGFEASAWYWHFVDVVWLFLFTFVYWWAAF